MFFRVFAFLAMVAVVVFAKPEPQPQYLAYNSVPYVYSSYPGAALPYASAISPIYTAGATPIASGYPYGYPSAYYVK